jgi:hypothetical protein
MKIEPPRDPAEHECRVLPQDPGQDDAHRRQAVDDRDLRVGILVLELACHRARRQVMPLADVRGDDQDLTRTGFRVGFAGRYHGRRVLLARLRRLLTAPLHVTADALGERRRGRPAEVAPGAFAAHDLAAEVARSSGRVHDLDVADELFDGLGDLLDGDVLVTCEVVDAVAGDFAGPERNPVSEILHVHKPARLASVAGERQWLAAQGLVDERRDYRRLTRARTIGDPESEDRVVDPVELLVGLAVQLAGELGAGVQVTGRGQQRVFVDRLGLAVGVNPDRARVHDPLDAGPSCRLEHRDRAPRVDPLRVLGLRVDVVDVGDGRQMRHRVAAVKRALERLAVGDGPEHGVDRAGRMPWRRPQVVDHRLVSARSQFVDHVRADEARSTCDENSHAPCSRPRR